MSRDDLLLDPSTHQACGCTDSTVPAPVLPGQAQLPRRLSSWAQTLERMRGAVSTTTIPDGLAAGSRPLSALATGNPSDPSVALLDAVASAAEVLAVYQEILSNELYLGTCTQPETALALAHHVGFRRRAPLAARGWISVDVRKLQRSAVVPAGSTVQSDPERTPGGASQTYEVRQDTPVEVQDPVSVRQLIARTFQDILAEAVSEGEKVSQVVAQGARLGISVGDRLLAEWTEDGVTEVKEAPYVASVEPDEQAGTTRIGFSEDLEPTGVISDALLSVFRVRGRWFGWNAPVKDPVNEAIYSDTQLEIKGSEVVLDGVLPIGSFRVVLLGIPGTSHVVEGMGMQLRVENDLYTTGYATAIKLQSALTFTPSRRDVTIWTDPSPLTIAPQVDTSPVQATIDVHEDLAAGSVWILSDGIHAERVQVEASTRVTVLGPPGDHFTLTLADALTHSYVRADARLYGNVVEVVQATSQAGALGSSDGSANQRIALPSGLPAELPGSNVTGRESSLRLRVDGVLWRQVDRLLFAGPRDRVYALVTDDAGEAAIAFGDGVHGAVPPAGQANVTGTWSVGGGAQGNVPALCIGGLKGAPRSVVGVQVATAMSGGDDGTGTDVAGLEAEVPDDLRSLGRVVSAADHAAFARTFPGVGSAHLTDVVLEAAGMRTRALALTVLDATWAPAGDGLLDRLTDALDAASDHDIPVVALTPDAVTTFDVLARLRVHPDHEALTVQSAVEAALVERFAGARTRLAAAVSLSEIEAVGSGVAGVSTFEVLGAASEAVAAGSTLVGEAHAARAALSGSPAALSPRERARWLSASALAFGSLVLEATP